MLSWHAQKLIKLEHHVIKLPGLSPVARVNHRWDTLLYYTISSQLVSIVQLSLRISCSITQLYLSKIARRCSLSPQCPTLPSEPSDGPHLLLQSPQPLLPLWICYMSIIVLSLNSEEWRMIPFWQFSCVNSENHPHLCKAYMYTAKSYNAKTGILCGKLYANCGYISRRLAFNLHEPHLQTER